MTKDTGGPAFPHPEAKYGSLAGMTLRDYFAGQALMGTIAGCQGLSITNQQFVEQAYILADAMILQRSKE